MTSGVRNGPMLEIWSSVVQEASATSDWNPPQDVAALNGELLPEMSLPFVQFTPRK